jgi:phenylpyruvate tautomerase PptA (4-oxalocrotonate tautomerase family)
MNSQLEKLTVVLEEWTPNHFQIQMHDRVFGALQSKLLIESTIIARFITEHLHEAYGLQGESTMVIDVPPKTELYQWLLALREGMDTQDEKRAAHLQRREV